MARTIRTQFSDDFPDDLFIVICRGDRRGRRKAPYVLATRRTFATRDEGDKYAATVSPSRDPLVVSGRFHQLRFAQGQGWGS